LDIDKVISHWLSFCDSGSMEVFGGRVWKGTVLLSGANIGIAWISRDADNSANIRALFFGELRWLDVMI
jgi:hypothetical protein